MTVTTLLKGQFAAAVVFFEGFGVGFLGFFVSLVGCSSGWFASLKQALYRRCQKAPHLK